jgi:hypothetical protein
MTNDSIITQLNEIYLLETWHKERLSQIEAWKYHDKLLLQGNIITLSDGDILCGYVEQWRISFEQFGRIICGEPFSAMHENVQNGQIAYVANTYIRPEYRNGRVYKMLRDRFFEFNKECTHFCGIARRKKSAPVKVFKREQVLERIS